VKKIVLVYDIEEIILLEKKLDVLVDKKKEAVKEANFNYNTQKIKEINEEIEKMEKIIR